MSGHERFYHQDEEITGSYKRKPAVTGAPYVLCVFIVGIILLGVGTFITTHTMETHPDDSILMIVGPVLLGGGGLFMLGAVLICTIACCRNSQLKEALSDDLINIGSSTFYGGRGFAYLVNDDQVSIPGDVHHGVRDGINNPVGPPQETEAIVLLAKTVAEEHDRQRKYSKKHLTRTASGNSNGPCQCNSSSCSHLAVPEYNQSIRNHEILIGNVQLDHLGLEKIHRVDPYPELAKDFDLGEGPTYHIRDRSASVYTRQQHPLGTPVPNRLRRNVTYTAASRARIAAKRQQSVKTQQQQHQQQQVPIDLQPKLSPQIGRGSLRKKSKDKKESDTSGNIRIHQLPRYDPNLLNALGITPMPREVSESEYTSDPSRDPSQAQGQDSQGFQRFPDNGHGSLRHPRRRPSMAAGTRGIRVNQPSGSAYRHRSSIYASDMSLHRGIESVAMRQESIPEDVRRSEDEVSINVDDRRLSSSFPKASYHSSDIRTRMTKKKKLVKRRKEKTWSFSSSSISSANDGGSHRRSPLPRSTSSSSSCSCHSEGDLNNPCSGCDDKHSGDKTCMDEQVSSKL